jgi:capsular polysaccharide transport system permease protein
LGSLSSVLDATKARVALATRGFAPGAAEAPEWGPPFRSGSVRGSWRDWRDAPLRWLDAVIAFVALEKALVLSNVRMVARGNFSRAFIGSVRLYVVVIAHMYLYWAVQRNMPGTISYLDFNVAGFALWAVFSNMVHKVVPRSVGAQFNIALNIRWINLYIADFIWELAKIMVAFAALRLQFWLFPQREVVAGMWFPNMPMFIGMIMLIAVLGSSFGLLLHTLRRRWPVIDATVEAVMWFLFVTSGIYEPYSQLPAVVGDYFRYNPVMVVIEYSRMALDPGYPVNDLKVSYAVAFAFVMLSIGLLLRHSGIRHGKR